MKLGILFQSPLGAQVAPIGSFKRSGTAAAIGIGVGAAHVIGSGIESYYNLKNQADTNKTNYRIWQEQLAAQRENWKREQDNYLQNRRWQLQDIAEQRNYDSPSSQKQRYLAAGINPYLANGIGQGSTASPPPTPPSFSSPAPAPTMQAGRINLDLGQGIATAAQAYYGEKEDQRADYALGADITFRDRTTRAQLLDSATKAKEAGVNAKWVDSQIQDANRNYYFNQDRFAAENERFEMQHALDTRRVELEGLDTLIKQKSLENDIRLSHAQIAQMTQAIKESVQRVDNMAAEQDLSYKEYQLQLQKTMFDMKAELLRIGISNEQLKSQKFKDFFGSIVGSLATGAGIYFGFRGARAAGSAFKSAKSYKGAPFKMDPYDPVKDTPWNSW